MIPCAALKMKTKQVVPSSKSKKSGRTPQRIAKRQAIAKARAVSPDVRAHIGSTPKTRFRGAPDIFGRLVQDHDRHRALFAMIGQTKRNSRDRVRLFNALVLEVKGHAAAEDQALWSTVLRNPATTEDARHAISEHKKLDEMLADLAARNKASRGWLRRLAKTHEKYLHHIREEEKEQFAAAQRLLSRADVVYLRGVFNRRKAAEKASARIEPKIKLKR